MLNILAGVKFCFVIEVFIEVERKDNVSNSANWYP